MKKAVEESSDPLGKARELMRNCSMPYEELIAPYEQVMVETETEMVPDTESESTGSSIWPRSESSSEWGAPNLLG